MLFVKKIIRLTTLLVLVCCITNSKAQINSPFSRYGIGNETYHSQNASSQGMGGFTAAYTPSMNGNFGQSVNFNNPASYGGLYMTTFDLAVNLTNATLKSENPTLRYQSAYFVPNYLSVGMPIDKVKKIGMAFGLRPLSQINYSIVEPKLLSSGDSLYNNYTGQGGLNQAYIGFGKSWKHISLGFNTGYNFGKKNIENIKTFQYNADSTAFYQSKASTNTLYGGVFLQLGVLGEYTLQTVNHTIATDKTEYSLSYGGTFTLNQNMSAKQDILRTTGAYSSTVEVPLDTVSLTSGIAGKVNLPATITTGIALHKKEISNRGSYDQWVLGIQYDMANWKDKYSFYGETDQLSNAHMMRVGLQFCPNAFDYENYWSTVIYRAGFNTGKDYINYDQNGMNVTTFTVGAGFPVRKYRSYDYQFSLINLALQFGKRGSSANAYQESFLQFTVGYSLSDVWFNKRKYD
ncbi:MAG: hypothetical protein RLZ56_514 [Bacteroidota bacterium]|jgi:hypothetical protein